MSVGNVDSSIALARVVIAVRRPIRRAWALQRWEQRTLQHMSG
ncbi:hypothetical protein [Streptomyces sp. G-G2]|nr:hypothetical protein [Streptomyces sp. G-G2]MDJ0385577.1 hypothetical protein [Streptomyces sp. G-G2]